MKTPKILKDEKVQSLIMAGLLLAVGILFLIYQSSIIGTVLSIAMTVVGIVFIVLGVLDVIGQLLVPGIVKIVAGIVVIALGWLILDIVLFVLAICLIFYGIMNLVKLLKQRATEKDLVKIVLLYASPIIEIVLGCLLLFNKMSAIFDPICIIFGVICIIEAVVMALPVLKK